MDDNRWRLGLAVWCLCVLMCTSASADPYDLNIQNFRPAPDARSLITVERSRSLGTLEPSLGLYLDHAWQPLKQSIGGRDEVLVEQLMSGRFVLSIGLFNLVQIGGSLPISVIVLMVMLRVLTALLVMESGMPKRTSRLSSIVRDHRWDWHWPPQLPLIRGENTLSVMHKAWLYDRESLWMLNWVRPFWRPCGDDLLKAQALNQPVLIEERDTGIQLPLLESPSFGAKRSVITTASPGRSISKSDLVVETLERSVWNQVRKGSTPRGPRRAQTLPSRQLIFHPWGLTRSLGRHR